MIIDTKNIRQSNTLKIVILSIISIAIIFALLQAGIFIGFHKASFLYKSGDNFYSVFGDREDRLLGGMRMMGTFRDEFSGGHGAIGKIVKINLPTIVVAGPDNIERIVIVNENTSVRNMRNVTTIDALNVNQYVTILGTPNNQGEIVATYIRIMPQQVMGTTTPFIKNIK